MSQIDLYDKLQSQDPFKAIEVMGKNFAKSGMFGCDREEAGHILAMICMTEQMTPTQVTQKYHIIDGKLSRKAGSALAEFKARGGKIRWVRNGQEADQSEDNRIAIGEFEYEGEKQEVSFSMEDARRAGLVRKGSTWEKMPWKMLRARVASDALGMLAPEIYYGDDIEEPDPAPREIKLTSEPTPAPERSVEPASEPTTVEVSEAEPQVFEAEIVKEESRPTEPAQSAPAPPPRETTPSETPPPTQEPDPAREPTKPALSDEMTKQLQDKIGGDAEIAMAYLVHKGWLAKGQWIDCLQEGRARSIITHHESFLKKARKFHEAMKTEEVKS